MCYMVVLRPVHFIEEIVTQQLGFITANEIPFIVPACSALETGSVAAAR